MDKNTLSNYGWIVIAVLVLAVMIALATPFGTYIKSGVESTTAGLFDTSEKALNVVGMSATYQVKNVISKYEHHTGYISNLGVIKSDAESKYIRIPVNSGENWYIYYPKFSNLNIGSGALRFENSDNDLISYCNMLKQCQYVGDFNSNKTGILVTIPEKTSYMCLNLKLSSAFDYTSSAYIGNTHKTFTSTWLTVGDSLTEYNKTSTRNWVKITSDELSLKVYNNAVSGTGYLYKGGFIQNINTNAENVDLVTIFGSFNDLSTSAEIGATSDVYVEGSNNSLAACMNNTYDYIQSHFPDAKIAVIAPTPWTGYKPTGTDVSSIKAQQYVDVMKDICESRGIPFLDLFRNSGLTPWDTDFNNQYYHNADGCHPNDEGHKIIAPIMTEFIENVLNS